MHQCLIIGHWIKLERPANMNLQLQLRVQIAIAIRNSQLDQINRAGNVLYILMINGPCHVTYKFVV
jgi:hypothetical protein